LTVLRHNRATTVSGLAANFHTFACGTAAACVNDGNDLSQWAMPVTLNGTDISYTVTVTDPSQPANATLAANYTPRFLYIQSVGHGPRGAVKVMEMMVDDYAFDFTTHAAIALHSHDTDTLPMTFTIGNSQPHLRNG